MWKDIEAAPADSIFGLTEAFRKETNPRKVNLGVGVYKDDQGRTPVLQCVKAAEKLLLEKEESKSYLPISGDPLYSQCVQRLIFGNDSEVIKSDRAATIHAPGGTGALRIGAQLLNKFNANGTVWVSTPTWANHMGIFSDAGFAISQYPYYNKESKGLDFEDFEQCLLAVPEGDLVLFHACCHNPSGVDLGEQQWRRVAEIAEEKKWIPFLDFAYQGFSKSLELDRRAVELMAEKEIDFLVASSFSKNFGLYNERTGALTIVAPSAREAEVAMSHLKKTVRVIYSNPPAHGGLTVATVLSDDSLYKQWVGELEEMRNRIIGMRTALVDGLSARDIDTDFSFIKDQSGMFSFSGLNDDTISWLRNNKGIYIVGGGRINVAGLTSKNIDYVCDSIAEAFKTA
ncbi:MAG: amino acid aminotransferase [Desulfocapsaceae bacterium]|nr:amino acid aminotransferase [Desulfocapsaceae bacterium]